MVIGLLYQIMGKKVFYFANHKPVDAMTVDQMLPSFEGLTIVKTLRMNKEKHFNISYERPFRSCDKVEGLQAGADNYLAKPIFFIEVWARIEALIRRAVTKTKDTPSELNMVDLVLNLQEQTDIRNCSSIDIKLQEFNIFKCLRLNKIEW